MIYDIENVPDGEEYQADDQEHQDKTKDAKDITERRDSLLSTESKKARYEEFVRRTERMPYLRAIEGLSELQDPSTTRSPFEMVLCISDMSKHIEETITDFWSGIDVIDNDKLIIDGDNILMLYLYIIVMAKIPKMFAYVKMMDEFSTTYVRSISRFGYCLSTLEIALERITQTPLADLVALQQREDVNQRNKQFVRNMRESFMNATHRGGSLYVEGEGNMIRRPSETNSSHLEGVSLVRSKRSPRASNASMARNGNGRLTMGYNEHHEDLMVHMAPPVRPSGFAKLFKKRLGDALPKAANLMTFEEVK